MRTVGATLIGVMKGLGGTLLWKTGAYFVFLTLARHGCYRSLLLAWFLL